MKKSIWILTLFPEYFAPLLNAGIAGKALKNERSVDGAFSFDVKLVNIRDFSLNKYKSVDDTSYGGGAGMLILPEVLKQALLEGVVKPGNYGDNFKDRLHVVFTSPRGATWNNEKAKNFAENFWHEIESKDLVFICGRYEGIDERFIELYVDEQISIGDYILTGGEIATMSILDSALRYVSGVLGNKCGAAEESFEDDLLEEPQYTKPRIFDGLEVPEVLLNGHHEKIMQYKQTEKERLTKIHRPDLWQKFLARKGSHNK